METSSKLEFSYHCSNSIFLILRASPIAQLQNQAFLERKNTISGFAQPQIKATPRVQLLSPPSLFHRPPPLPATNHKINTSEHFSFPQIETLFQIRPKSGQNPNQNETTTETHCLKPISPWKTPETQPESPLKSKSPSNFNIEAGWRERRWRGYSTSRSVARYFSKYQMARGEERLLGVDLESFLTKNGQARALLRLWRCSTIVNIPIGPKAKVVRKGT